MFQFIPGAYADEIMSVSGIVGRDIERRTLAVHALATNLVNVDTGRLRSSLRWVMRSDASGPVGVVSTDVSYAIWVHDGTRWYKGNPYLVDALEAAK